MGSRFSQLRSVLLRLPSCASSPARLLTTPCPSQLWPSSRQTASSFGNDQKKAPASVWGRDRRGVSQIRFNENTSHERVGSVTWITLFSDECFAEGNLAIVVWPPHLTSFALVVRKPLTTPQEVQPASQSLARGLPRLRPHATGDCIADSFGPDSLGRRCRA